jgi:ACT domain-containing protein
MYHLHIYGPLEGNVDVEITFPDGKRFAATFFTLKNIQELMENHASTGESLNGLYFWASDMVIIQDILETNIRKTIENLISTGEFEIVFKRLEHDQERISE